MNRVSPEQTDQIQLEEPTERYGKTGIKFPRTINAVASLSAVSETSNASSNANSAVLTRIDALRTVLSCRGKKKRFTVPTWLVLSVCMSVIIFFGEGVCVCVSVYRALNRFHTQRCIRSLGCVVQHGEKKHTFIHERDTHATGFPPRCSIRVKKSNHTNHRIDTR